MVHQVTAAQFLSHLWAAAKRTLYTEDDSQRPPELRWELSNHESLSFFELWPCLNGQTTIQRGTGRFVLKGPSFEIFVPMVDVVLQEEGKEVASRFAHDLAELIGPQESPPAQRRAALLGLTRDELERILPSMRELLVMEITLSVVAKWAEQLVPTVHGDGQEVDQLASYVTLIGARQTVMAIIQDRCWLLDMYYGQRSSGSGTLSGNAFIRVSKFINQLVGD